MRSFISVLALGLLAVSGVAKAEEYDAIDESTMEADADASLHEPNMLLRLKSGTTFPAQNGEVSHFFPITMDWSYTGFEHFNVGAELTWATGSHGVERVDLTSLQTGGFHMNRSMANLLATFDYKFRWGNARMMTGVKAGAVFFRESYTRETAPFTMSTPPNNTKTVATAGPSLNLDMPIKGAFFVNLGGDYLIGDNSIQSGSLYAGLGAEF